MKISTSTVTENTAATSQLMMRAAQSPRRLHAFLLERFGEQRDEGGVERALGEQPAEQIGKAEGGEKASAAGPVPSTAATSASRMKPSTRLPVVIAPTLRKLR